MTDCTPHPRPPSSRKKRTKEMTAEEKEVRRFFYRHGVPSGYQAHHVIYEQVLRNYALGHLIYDRRNRLVIPQERHEQHHSANGPKIQYQELSQNNLDFAAEVGMEWWVEQHYPDEELEAA